MILAEVAIRRPVFTIMVTLALIVFGFISLRDIGVDLFPEIEFPFVTVTTLYPGADSETVETEVSEKIEEAVNTVAGIKSLRSTSLENMSLVMIEFELEEDVDIVAQDVRDKVAGIRSDLPDDIEEPIIEKFNFSGMPVMLVSLSGEEDIREITFFAKNRVKPALEKISGVGRVRLIGGREREIKIWINKDRLEAFHLAVSDIINTLRTQNVDIPGGRLEMPTEEMVVKTRGELSDPKAFGDLIVQYRNGVPIRLREVAVVEDDMEDERSYAAYNGQRNVTIEIQRQSDANTAEVAGLLREELARLDKIVPEGMTLTVTLDNSEYIVQAIRSVQEDLVVGAILAIIVIFIFLRNIRSTLITAVVIPTSLISTFTFMYAMGFTTNNLTMLAMSICVGIVIDDAIVVIENIYRHVEMGHTGPAGVGRATSEIGLAVLAATLTICAVFIPVAFMKGIIGRFFYEFGITVAVAVLISLFVSFTLTPMMSSRLLKAEKEEKHGKLFNQFEKAYRGLENVYGRFIGVALNFRAITILIAVAVFIVSLFMAGMVDKEFLPAEDESRFQVSILTPDGYTLQQTLALTRQVEEDMRSLPHVTDTLIQVGGGQKEKVNEASIQVFLTDKGERETGQEALMARARDKLEGYGDNGTNISVARVPRMGGGGFRNFTIQYNLRGPDLDVLDKKAQEMLTLMKDVDGLVDLDTTYKHGKPELNIELDRDIMADQGVDVTTVAMAVKYLVGGDDVTTYKEAGEEYDVRIRLLEEDRIRPEQVLNLTVRNRFGQLIRLADLIRIYREFGPTEIERESRQRQVTVLANLAPGYALGTALEEIQQLESRLELGPEYTTAFTGMGDIFAESFGYLMFALFLAVVLIYMILASQFESFLHPFTIMLSLPLSIVGVMAGLLIAGQTLSIFSMIGIIMLMGLVTKNAILLVDFANQARRDEGLSTRDALIQAGRLRLRPILMTAASTIFGMLPIALGFGEGAESRSPMAVAVIGGLMTSTFLTLIVIPVVYSLFDSLTARLSGGGGSGDHGKALPEENKTENSASVEEKSLVQNVVRGERNDASPA